MVQPFWLGVPTYVAGEFCTCIFAIVGYFFVPIDPSIHVCASIHVCVCVARIERESVCVLLRLAEVYGCGVRELTAGTCRHCRREG